VYGAIDYTKLTGKMITIDEMMDKSKKMEGEQWQ